VSPLQRPTVITIHLGDIQNKDVAKIQAQIMAGFKIGNANKKLVFLFEEWQQITGHATRYHDMFAIALVPIC
jgi:hypothetical protein